MEVSSIGEYAFEIRTLAYTGWQGPDRVGAAMGALEAGRVLGYYVEGAF